MNILNNTGTNLISIKKQLHVLLFFLVITISTTSMAQTKKDSTKTEKEPEQTSNFLDMGSETLGEIFGENLDGKSSKKNLSFLELLEKMDMPADQKAEYKNWYYLQSKNLTEKQKDSLGTAIEKKIREAQLENTKN